MDIQKGNEKRVDQVLDQHSKPIGSPDVIADVADQGLLAKEEKRGATEEVKTIAAEQIEAVVA